MRFCVITYYCKVVVGLGHTDLYNVRSVGSGSRDVDTWRGNISVHRRLGDPSTDNPGSWQHCGDSMMWQTVPWLLRPDGRVRQRISDRWDPVYPSGPHCFFQWLLKLIHSCPRGMSGCRKSDVGNRKCDSWSKIECIVVQVHSVPDFLLPGRPPISLFLVLSFVLW
jgi:hypothetical protein